MSLPRGKIKNLYWFFPLSESQFQRIKSSCYQWLPTGLDLGDIFHFGHTFCLNVLQEQILALTRKKKLGKNTFWSFTLDQKDFPALHHPPYPKPKLGSLFSHVGKRLLSPHNIKWENVSPHFTKPRDGMQIGQAHTASQQDGIWHSVLLFWLPHAPNIHSFNKYSLTSTLLGAGNTVENKTNCLNGTQLPV